MKSLGDIGVVESVQGSGVFVRDQLRVNSLALNSLTRVPYSRIVSKCLGFERVRIVNGAAEQIETSFMPTSLSPDLSRQIIEKSIQGYVEAKGFKISHFMTSYEPIAIERKQAEILGCKRGRAAMHIQNRGVLASARLLANPGQLLSHKHVEDTGRAPYPISCVNAARNSSNVSVCMSLIVVSTEENTSITRSSTSLKSPMSSCAMPISSTNRTS